MDADADPRLDPQLISEGDTRNVIDRYRNWTVEAIVADLDARRHPFHVAIENFEHDMNIGSVVRSANAFLAAEVHIVGHRRWNRRGAMVTERYQHVRHHESIEGLVAWASEGDIPLIGIDNVEGSVPIETYDIPSACVLVFGQDKATLSGDCYAPVTVLASLKACQGFKGANFSKNVAVNIVPTTPGQVDLGSASGKPLSEAKVGEVLAVDVAVWAPTSLKVSVFARFLLVFARFCLILPVLPDFCSFLLVFA